MRRELMGESRIEMPALSTMPNAALPTGLRKKATDAVAGADMAPEDWRGLVGGLLEFFKEEAAEPEHAQDVKTDAEHSAVIEWNGEFNFGDLFRALWWLGQAGASRSIEIAADDSGTQKELLDKGYRVKFGWDGDGADKIVKAVVDGVDVAGKPFTGATEDSWEEGKHPRKDDGKFGSGGGAAKSKSSKLTPTEKAYLSSYSGDDFLRLNKELRAGEPGGEAAKKLDSAVSKSIIPAGTKLYRGMTKDALKSLIGGNEINVGHVLSDKAFLSTSSDKFIANVPGGVMLEIGVGEKQRGLDMSGISSNAHEKETILPRNTKLKIEGIRAPKNVGEPIIVRVSTVADTAEDAAGAMDGLKLALDESMRSVDEYGHMHVKVSNISKAQIRPYLGKEIPGWNEEEQTHLLGLDPDKTYNMLCPAEELAKSVKAWNGKPLLLIHKPSEADEHPTEETIGSVYNVDFVDPYLRAALSVWRQEGIDLIETEEQREISCGYGYDPEMTAGVFNGEPFQGIMRNLRPNHVAIVEEGRAGPDVLVADSVIEHQWAILENALSEGWLQ
jgi:Uncharacterized protein conserved in bacteria (DUF2213)/ADP-ribosyltransferase exoenzyme